MKTDVFLVKRIVTDLEATEENTVIFTLRIFFL